MGRRGFKKGGCCWDGGEMRAESSHGRSDRKAIGGLVAGGASPRGGALPGQGNGNETLGRCGAGTPAAL